MAILIPERDAPVISARRMEEDDRERKNTYYPRSSPEQRAAIRHDPAHPLIILAQKSYSNLSLSPTPPNAPMGKDGRLRRSGESAASKIRRGFITQVRGGQRCRTSVDSSGNVPFAPRFPRGSDDASTV